MEQRHKDILRANRFEIASDLRFRDIRRYLMDKGVLTWDNLDEIENQPSRESQVKALLDILPTRGPNAFSVFREALQQSYPHLSRLLSDEGSSGDTETIAKEPRVFIIHAGEDKDSFVRPLVSTLQKRGLNKDDIFFDEHSIKPGEICRNRIMSTLESQKLQLAVIVVSTSLLNKPYWPKLEFETCLKNNKRIFPIWVDENQDNFKTFCESVGKYSPSLKQLNARRVQRDSVEEEMSNVAAEIIQRLPPPPIQALLDLRPSGIPPSDSGSSYEDIAIGRKRRHATGDNDGEGVEKKLKEKMENLKLLRQWGKDMIELLKEAESLQSREDIESLTKEVLLDINKHGIDILRVKEGCTVIHLVPNNDESLERFWTDYRSGQLSRDLSKYLITDEMRHVAGQDLMIGVIILEEQYRQWKEYFQVREEDIQQHERLEDELRLSVLNQDSPPEIHESQLSYAFTAAAPVEDVRVRSGTATEQQNITQGGAEREAEHQDSGKAVDSQKPDVGSPVQGHTTQTATTRLHSLISKISQEVTDKDVETVKDNIRIDQGEERMASYDNLRNLTDIFKQLEADNYLGSDDDEKLSNTIKLFDGVENFDSRHFEFLQQLDSENARKNTAFVGREEDMENLMHIIKANKAEGDNGHVKIIWINGFPGVGKTTFAHQLCLKQGRRKIFISLGKVTSVDNMLTLIMREFGVTEINGDGNTEIEAMVAHLIGTHNGEDCSLVLDDADSLLEVAESRRRFVGLLAKVQDKQNPKFHVIVTSRSSIMSSEDVPRMEATIVDLKELAEPAGTVLVQTLVGKSNIIEEEALEVSRRCKGWPLAITIACGVIRKDHLQPAEMIKRLGNLTEISDIRSFLTDVVSTLSRDLLVTLKLVSVFAGPFTVESACIISGRPDQLFQVWSHLRELRTRSLIKAGSESIDGAPRFDTHDVVRTFVSDLESDAVTVQEMAAAKYRFEKLYEERLTAVAQNLQGDIKKALASYSRDVDNFNHFLSLIQKETQDDYEWRRKERDDSHSWLMDVKAGEVADRSAVHILLEQMMVVNERIAFYTGQAERLEKQNTQIYAEMLCWLAETYLQVNMHREAQEQLEKARKALEARPDREEDSVQLSFARYHYVSGIYFSLRDDYKRNVRHLDQALQILSKVKIAGNHVLHARVMNSKGFAHHNHAKNMWRGRAYLEMLQNSLAMHQEAHDIITSVVGQDNHFDCATYLMNIGVVYLDIGWYFNKTEETNEYFDKALKTFCDAEELVKVLDLEKQHNSGLLQYNIARCHEALGDLDEAISRVRRAQKVLESIYDSHPDIADCLYFLGKLNKDNGDPTSAMKYYKQSLEHTAELGNRRSEYEWKRLKDAIMEICKSQEKAWYRQQFEKIDGTPYRESMSMRLTGFGSRMVYRMLRPLYTFISDVWKPKP